jgi:hypothetical protein
MKLNKKRIILSAAGILLSAGSALAAGNTTTTTDIVGNLGFFSTLAGTIMKYSKYIAFFMAVISLTCTVGIRYACQSLVQNRSGNQ